MEKPWLKYYDSQVPPPLEYPPLALQDLLDRSVEKFPKRIAIIFSGAKLSYQKLGELSKRFAASLQEFGIGKGEKVAIMLPNLPQTIIAFYGVTRLGAIVVPINPLYTEREIEFQLEDSGANTIIVLDALYPKIANLQSKNVIVVRAEEYLPRVLSLLYSLKKERKVKIEKRNGLFFFKDLVAKKPSKFSFPKPSPEDIVLLQYTGGTTGLPKGVVLTHKNLVANVTQVRHWYSTLKEGKEVFLFVLPFFHIYGLTVSLNFPIYIGATLVVLPSFNAVSILKAISTYKVTIFPGIPSMYTALLSQKRLKEYDLSSLRFCSSGASALFPQILKDFEEKTGAKLIEGYGLTEASPVTHSNPIEGERKAGSIGIPLPDTDCRLKDLEEGKRDLSPNEIGELCIQGPQVMKGYWNRDSETASALRDGWLYTGDMARMDEDGYFYIVDRKKDMVIVGGYNVYPKEVEDVISLHPKVKEVAVIGAPDKLRGEKVVAFVGLQEGKKARAEEIISFCRERLAKYKIPKKVEFRRELPKTYLGKVSRKDLKKEVMND